MIVVINISNYKNKYFLFGIFSMAVFNIILLFKKNKPKFIKFMGTGKNGTFDIVPDFNQWALLGTWENLTDYKIFMKSSNFEKYINLFSSDNYALVLQPTMSHGLWDSQNPFESLGEKESKNNPVGVLTRATIRLSKLRQFWQNVPLVSKDLDKNDGFIYSIGIGEIPFIKQATFSIWETEENMKDFAYKKMDHNEVIKKTRKNDWYSEELFARFCLKGYIGNAPLQIKKILEEL